MKHFYYPSSRVGCRRDIFELKAPELTTHRHEVDCPGCLKQLEADKLICARCRDGSVREHTCDGGDNEA